MVPQKWQPNFAHAVRFIETLKAKLESFEQPFARVDFRVYHSGAHGPRQALQHAFEDNVPRKGLPFVDVPFTWVYIPMQFNAKTKKYEEDPNNLLPSCGVGHKRGYAERKVSDLYNYPHETRCSFVWSV